MVQYGASYMMHGTGAVACGRVENLLVHNHRLVWELIRFAAMKKASLLFHSNQGENHRTETKTKRNRFDSGHVNVQCFLDQTTVPLMSLGFIVIVQHFHLCRTRAGTHNMQIWCERCVSPKTQMVNSLATLTPITLSHNWSNSEKGTTLHFHLNLVEPARRDK